MHFLNSSTKQLYAFHFGLPSPLSLCFLHVDTHMLKELNLEALLLAQRAGQTDFPEA